MEKDVLLTRNLFRQQSMYIKSKINFMRLKTERMCVNIITNKCSSVNDIFCL